MTDIELLNALVALIGGGAVIAAIIFTGDYLTHRDLQKRLRKELEAKKCP